MNFLLICMIAGDCRPKILSKNKVGGGQRVGGLVICGDFKWKEGGRDGRTRGRDGGWKPG